MSVPMVPITELHPNPANIRDDLGTDEELDELARSIRAVGLLQPIVVTRAPDGWLVIDGHRRLEAARRAGAKALPCVAKRPTDPTSQVPEMLAAAMHKNLTTLEEARAFHNLRLRRLSVADIARMTGYQQSRINRRLLLLDLPVEAQDMVETGELGVTEAETLAREVRASGSGEVTKQPTKATRPAQFTAAHKLAGAVTAACSHTETRQVVGRVGCGGCWEKAIREDERAQVLQELGLEKRPLTGVASAA